MKIDKFINKSEGKWKSMRSGHSLSFQKFEQITSKIKIEKIPVESIEVKKLINEVDYNIKKVNSPFRIEWAAESDWGEDDYSSGECICIPINANEYYGKIIRSLGYTEPVQSVSEYVFLNDDTFVMNTKYNQSIVEERIWFVSDNVRSRSSVTKTSKGSGVIQASFASEVRQIEL